FGGFRYPINGSPLTNEGMQDMSLFLHYKNDNQQRPLVTNILKDNHYRKLYLAHIRTIVEENFSNGWYRERATAIRQMINEEVAKEPQRLYDMAAYEQNLSQSVKIDNSTIIGLTELMDARAQQILAHPLMQKPAPTLDTPDVTVKGTDATFTVSATEATDAYIYHRTSAFAPWQRTTLNASDGQWTATIPAATAQHYFVVAENKYIASCLPRRAGREYLELVVK
ncbi:MAG: CotH kinase family protein, partial [Bacteroidota bacterium]